MNREVVRGLAFASPSSHEPGAVVTSPETTEVLPTVSRQQTRTAAGAPPADDRATHALQAQVAQLHRVVVGLAVVVVAAVVAIVALALSR
jgi:uncharacterized membrane protein